MHQPTLFETPYTAMCEPAARGPGTIADDVYALGVLMMWLAAGKMPCEGMTDDEIIRAKLGMGGFAALSRDLRLSGFMNDLLSGMLAAPNLGPDYGQAYQLAFARLGERPGVIFDPFFMEGVAAKPASVPDGLKST